MKVLLLLKCCSFCLLLILFNAYSVPTKNNKVEAPCDIYYRYGTPCVAAHSLVRALYNSYNGPLYLVRRDEDNATKAIHTVSPGGVANSQTQDEFCRHTNKCTVQRIYDQSPEKNHLDTAPPGEHVPKADKGVNANREKLTLHGQIVYGAYFEGGMGYRIEKTSGIAVADEPETIYMVTSGRHYNDGCCFDYGNAESDAQDHGPGTMEAVYWGNNSQWGRGEGSQGPWVMADLEDGLWSGRERFNPQKSLNLNYVMAMVKGNSGGTFALKVGDAKTSNTLQTVYSGKRPDNYNPMKKQGAIILGIGGDNSDQAIGTFYEGVMTKGFSSDQADHDVHENIVQAGYGM